MRSGKSFEGDGGNFKYDALFNRKPVKRAEGRRDVIAALVVGKDNAGKGVLNGLEAMNGRVRKVVEERIAVVKARGNKGVGESDGGVSVKERADLPENTKLEEGGLADRGDMISEGMVRVKGYPEVSGRSGRSNGVILKGDRRVEDLGTLLGCANYEEFSFGRVEDEFIGCEPVMKGD